MPWRLVSRIEESMNESVAESGLSTSISGFWRRVGALAIDTVVLGLAGMIVGVVLFDPLARMGGYERLIGFAIAWAYFGILNSSLGGQSPFRDLLAMMNDLAGQPHVLHTSVVRGWTSSSRGETHYLQSQLRLDAPLVDDEEMAKRFAQHMLKMDMAGDKDETINVSLIYGYDMVIASGWHRHAFSFKRDELQ